MIIRILSRRKSGIAGLRYFREPSPALCVERADFTGGPSGALDETGPSLEREIMFKVIAICAIALSAAACTTTERRTAGGALIGGGTGAVIGGIAGGGTGAAIGGAIGAGTGAVIGAATSPGDCYARDAYGRTVSVPCRY
jgi:hypothetical protein